MVNKGDTLLALGEAICHFITWKAMFVSGHTNWWLGNDWVFYLLTSWGLPTIRDYCVKFLDLTDFYYSISWISLEQNHNSNLEFCNIFYQSKIHCSLGKADAKCTSLGDTCITMFQGTLGNPVLAGLRGQACG